MQAAVAVRLGGGDVVLFLDERDVVLFEKGIRQRINVLGEGADDTYTCNIVQVRLDRRQCFRETLSSQFFENTLRLFETGLDRADRVAVVDQRVLLVQHLKFGLDLHHRTAVVAHEQDEWFGAVHHGFYAAFFVERHELLPYGAVRIDGFFHGRVLSPVKCLLIFIIPECLAKVMNI